MASKIIYICWKASLVDWDSHDLEAQKALQNRAAHSTPTHGREQNSFKTFLLEISAFYIALVCRTCWLKGCYTFKTESLTTS